MRLTKVTRLQIVFVFYYTPRIEFSSVGTLDVDHDSPAYLISPRSHNCFVGSTKTAERMG